MRTVLWRVAALAWLTLAAGTASAQTLPVAPLPEPSPEPEAGAPATAGSLAVAAPLRRRAWDYDLAAGGTYDSNVDFVQGGDSLYAIEPRASLTRLIWGPRGEMRLRGSGRWIHYPEDPDRSRGYGDFSLEGTYKASPRTTLNLNASFELGYTDSSATLRDQGLALPLDQTRTVTAGLGVKRRLGERTTLRLGARGLLTEFDAPELIDGTSVRGTVALEQAFGARSTGALVYSFEEVLADDGGDAYNTHYASLQWTRVVSRHSALLLEGGVGYTPDPERAGLARKESFFGGASLTRELGRASLLAYVRHEVTPAFGTGDSRPQLRSGLQADVPLSRHFTFRVSGTYVAAEEADDASGFPASLDASGALGWRVARAFEVTAESGYRRRGAFGGSPSVDAWTAGLFLQIARPTARSER